MNLLIELPTWLGDSVMASAAIESLRINYKDAKFTFFGAQSSIELYKNFPNATFLIDNRQKKISNLYKIAKSVKKIDLAISFRRSFWSRYFLYFIDAKKKFIYKDIKNIHQVRRYLEFLKRNKLLQTTYEDLKIYFDKKEKIDAIGLNPGAKYGDSKMWPSEYFAKVGEFLGKQGYEVLIFGTDKKVCGDIEGYLKNKNINFKNLCNKTNIKELCEKISSLKLFITNDSGPMHIAAAYKVPTISIFGSTNPKYTSSFKNKFDKIVKLDLSCMPCMKRRCPLKTKACMKELKPEIVIDQIKELK